MRSLNTRLMAGLLAVTAAGLLLMGLISVVVLRGYLTHRVDAQLKAVRNKPALARIGDSVAPSRYIILNVAPNGTVHETAADPPPDKALALARGVGADRLRAEAERGRPFRLGPMHAIARVGLRGRVVVVVAPLGEINAAVGGLALIELITGLALLAVLAALGRWLIRRGLSPLTTMATTAYQVASGGDLRARMDESPSEVGRLAGAINLMLARIEQAFAARLRSEATVREFAADASHELRTPLTTILGYSELYSQGAVDADEAMRRIDGEARRMSRLVEELLELARLDRGAGMSRTRVDLAGLARDAAADSEAVEPDRPVTYEGPPSLYADVDEVRVRQILANLMANVRSHTPPGTPAVVRLAEPAVLEVADEGPGMSEADAARAFDRFHGDGSGLGLAIVAAIAAAHGGRATLWSAPGSGTLVRVTLSGQMLEGVVEGEQPVHDEPGQR